MESIESTVGINDKNPHKNRVHKVLAHSYLLYFLLFLTSVFLDSKFPLFIVEGYNSLIFLGSICLLFGTSLVLWAQKSSHKFNKENLTKESFCNGPYCYTKNPTHYGLFFLMVGFGMIINSLLILIFSLISFLITKLVFLKKEEKILEEKYGTPYLEYKKSVKF